MSDRWLRATYARPDPNIRRAMPGRADGFLVEVLDLVPRTDLYTDSMSILQEAVLNDDVDWIRGLPKEPGLHEGWICVVSLANYHENPQAWWEPVRNDQDGGES